ncbi:MAG: histidine phosphatase family protein [Pseudomonadota bacterium]|nr:histidine phosphatase family protein [Pseudomonadota bacterium]MDQ8000988.1 histidine phosphatase family protein [Pseudomonadota bacterium]MDQ8018400.1 histidine phosphatase family protein [Pseudomonadota bacterium]
MIRATFVRHGQSTGNAGQPTRDLVAMPLTPLGVSQAREVACSWRREPTHIVSSPFLRARQTAEPTCVRFPGVPMAIWPIHEFTYLCPANWADTTRAQRRPTVEAYWQRADPAYVDGEGAESFSQVLRRAESALARLAALPDEAEVFLFSHGQFMQAVRQSVGLAGESDDDKMAQFWPFEQRSPVLNCQKLVLGHAGGTWRLVDEDPLAAPELPVAMDSIAARADRARAGGRFGHE